MSATVESILDIRGLSIEYGPAEDPVYAVRDFDLELRRGEVVSIVGESGSGKTSVATAVLGQVNAAARVTGSITIASKDVLGNRSELEQLRRNTMAAVFQDPMGSLNPVRTIRSQMFESARAAGILGRENQLHAVRESFDAVLLDWERIKSLRPHELSGGMCQRVVIAMAVLKQPVLLVADEPTSALDIQSQSEIVQILIDLRDRLDAGILLITHDLGLASVASNRIAVMYGGRLVELGAAAEVAAAPHHPYSTALMEATPRFDDDERRLNAIPGRLTVELQNGVGCPFRNRCASATQSCAVEFPSPRTFDETQAWCWNPIMREGAA